MARTHPDRLVFENEPADEDLAVLLGPDFAARELRWEERDGVVRIGPPRIPVAGAAIFLAGFGAVLSAVPWVLPRFGVRLPAHLTPGLVVGLTAAYWLLIAPAFVGLLAFLDGVRRRVGPGAIVDPATRRLELPRTGLAVAPAQVRAFVALKGRRRAAGDVSVFSQYSVLVEDAGRIVCAPVGKLTVHEVGATVLDRLATLYDVPVRRVRAPRVLD